MNKSQRLAKQMGVLHLPDIDWFLRVYLMLGDPEEYVDSVALIENLSEKVRIVATEYLSPEFMYIRTGFILAHYGRRGVTHSIWHWADWCGTWEYFCQAWYCYGRDVARMGTLDRSEPILCQHEIDVVMHEGMTFLDLASHCLTQDHLVKQYRDCVPYRERNNNGT